MKLYIGLLLLLLIAALGYTLTEGFRADQEGVPKERAYSLMQPVPCLH